MNLCVKTKYIRPSIISSLCRFSTTAPEVIEQNEPVLIEDNADTRAKEEEIAMKRNKSRLSAAHYNMINDRRPYETPRSSAHLTVKYNRKMYGKYGTASGVNPSICWPTPQEVAFKMEYEAIAFPFTIQEMMERAAEKRKAEQLKIAQREKELVTKFEKLEGWKQELKDKLAKKTAEAQIAKEKKERLVEEVRRHFGFKLDPRDERFQEMLAKREKEQKKLEKMARKEAKEKKMIAKIQQKNIEMS